MEVEKEYQRIKELFAGCDEQQISLLDGTFWECARLRVELNKLHMIVQKSGLVKIHPDNPFLQKELPVSKLIVRTRANYLNYIAKLSSILGKNVEEEDDDLGEFE